MILFLIFIIIFIGLYIYITKTDETFFSRNKEKLTNFINKILKKINP
jgi:preprotein translocase subunit SecG